MKLAQIINSAAKYAEQMRTYLDSAPHDEVFSISEVAAKVGLKQFCGRKGALQLPPSYCHRRDKSCVYLGHPKAIAALRKGLGVK